MLQASIPWQVLALPLPVLRALSLPTIHPLPLTPLFKALLKAQRKLLTPATKLTCSATISMPLALPLWLFLAAGM